MLDAFIKREVGFAKELRNLPVPERFQIGFPSHFALVQHIGEYETSEAEMLYWLAYEFQNQRREKVMLRLHMRYNKLRLIRERKELKCQDTRY